ncbi:hypothetical protein [Methylobacterium sp. PvR107]|jgi:hypothetical protein|uniref:hypothetical protein n=1 Tax=Methylobacterium sp. PvR107 TaxID=2806597 RepID=UPI001AE34F76|nr:hypothetical protein [Methylobacterium sp. PvR107]MBP1183861.1 hypothetical protein [Methylobacterium sp. PvR107]
MSNGLFQNLPGSHEMAGVQALPNEPWLLPISDRAAAAVGKSADELQAAVRQAARPFWLFANGLCVALGLALAVQCATGWTPAAPRSAVTVAQATPPTLAPQTASLQR